MTVEENVLPEETQEKGRQRKYYLPYVPFNITSFEALDAVHEAQVTRDEVWNLTDQFMSLIENIMFEMPSEEQPAALRDLSTDFADRMENILNGEPVDAKALGIVPNWLERTARKLLGKSDGFMVRKGVDGNWYGYGKPTNNFLDLENEILTEAAHREFIGYLKSHSDEMPELWLLHVDGTATTYKACWADYTDNAVHLVWRLTEEEAAMFKALELKYDLAMSHGFQVLKRTGNLIEKYRMKEASVLPRERAANPYTDFGVKEEQKMAFSKEDRQFLVDALGEEKVAALETANEKAAAILRQNVEHKSTDPTPEATPPADTPPEQPAFVTQAELDSLRSELSEAFGAILARLPQPTAAGDGEKSAPPPPETQPRMSILAAAMKSVDPTGDDAKPLDKTDPLTKSKPKETPVETQGGLVGLAAQIKNPDSIRRESDVETD